MNWLNLESVEQLQSIKASSKTNPVLIFKHSTQCSISRTALDRLERNWNGGEMEAVKPFLLDLLKHRDLSNQIASLFSVEHESPQVLLIENGEAVYDRSHFSIDYRDIASKVRKSTDSLSKN
jgi:bacillithiol system protein YtxJ